MTLTRQDIGTWLINLDRAQARRQMMEVRLGEIDLPYNRFAAVDGKLHEAALMQSVDASAFVRNVGRPILAGEIGCYQSHLNVWQALLESKHKVALILEDDVVFHEDFLSSIDLALEASCHWDVLRFNCIRAKIAIDQGHIGGYRLNAYIGPFTGNGAYLIKKDVAARLLPRLLPMTRPFDIELNRFNLHDYRLLGLEPWPSHVNDDGKSTITGQNFGEVKKFRWYKRLPNYRLRAANYLRRIVYLTRKGMLFPSGRAKKS